MIDAHMRWLRLVGSLKKYVSFAKEPYKRDLYSAKETYHFEESVHSVHSKSKVDSEYT